MAHEPPWMEWWEGKLLVEGGHGLRSARIVEAPVDAALVDPSTRRKDLMRLFSCFHIRVIVGARP